MRYIIKIHHFIYIFGRKEKLIIVFLYHMITIQRALQSFFILVFTKKRDNKINGKSININIKDIYMFYHMLLMWVKFSFPYWFSNGSWKAASACSFSAINSNEKCFCHCWTFLCLMNLLQMICVYDTSYMCLRINHFKQTL